ncbi:MAG: GDP-mannose 4,6-dehydratase [Eubacteriales bacterium]|nr:GDP-mannose 4,6-dehydratase [Eubacteriales bacterium]
MRIFLTGAAGFIGAHLSRRLLGQGHSVFGFDNLNDYYEVSLKESRLTELARFPAFAFCKGDLADEAAVNDAVRVCQPDVVINLAAQAGVRYSIINPRAYLESNMIGFFNVLEACRHSEPAVKHLIYASSSSVYGNQQKTPFSVEDNVDHPISLYAATKKSNELMAYTYSHLYGIPTTGLRFFTVYGPMGRPDMAYFSFARKILAGEPIQVFNNGDLYRDFTFIDDIVTGVANMVDRPPSGPDPAKVYNIGNNTPVKLTDFIHMLQKALSKVYGREILAEIEYKPMQPGDVYQTCADVDDLMRDFGFKPQTSLQDGLDQFAAWYRAYYGGAAGETGEKRP